MGISAATVSDRDYGEFWPKPIIMLLEKGGVLWSGREKRTPACSRKTKDIFLVKF